MQKGGYIYKSAPAKPILAPATPKSARPKSATPKSATPKSAPVRMISSKKSRSLSRLKSGKYTRNIRNERVKSRNGNIIERRQTRSGRK